MGHRSRRPVNSDARVITSARQTTRRNDRLRGAIERVLAAARGFVILDEAYAEFAGTSCLDLVAMNDRVLVVRTMSKAFGLAGLRVGYAVGAPALVAEVEKSRGPYKVSTVAERAAVASLTHDQGWVAERVEDARTSRERLAESLRALGLEPLPSEANFVLVPVAGRAASRSACASVASPSEPSASSRLWAMRSASPPGRRR